MRPKPSSYKSPTEKVIKDTRRATRKHYSAEDKIRIVLDGLRGESSIAELSRREGLANVWLAMPQSGTGKYGSDSLPAKVILGTD